MDDVCFTLRQKMKEIQSSDEDALINKEASFEDNVNKCYRRIIILCNYRERCTLELKRRLIDREKFDEAVFNAALEKAVKYNIVNDERYAQIYSFSKTQSCRGTDGVIKHLNKMNINYEEIPAVKEIIDKAKEQEFALACKYLENHPSKAKDLYSSNVKKLLNRGFSLNISINASKYLIDRAS